jgi:hypothetical protein
LQSSTDGGRLTLPKNIWHNTRFALLIDWNTNTHSQRQYVKRPEYCFDWVPEETRFDTTNLVFYEDGKMVRTSAQVIRTATMSPAHQNQ